MATEKLRIALDVIDRMREDYIKGETGSVDRMGEKYGVNPHTIRYHIKVGGWAKLREEYRRVRQNQALVVPGQIPDVPVVQPLDYQGQVQSFLASAAVIEGQWKECVAEASNDSLTPSERVAFHRASVQLSTRWQEVLRIPAVAAIKPEDKKPSNSETPAIPLEE